MRFRRHFRSNDFIVLVVPQRPGAGVDSNPTALNLKADAERLEKARAEISKKAARWRGEAARLENVNDDVTQDLTAVKEEIADLKKVFWPAALSRNPDAVAAALAAVDAPPLGGCARHVLARHVCYHVARGRSAQRTRQDTPRSTAIMLG